MEKSPLLDSPSNSRKKSKDIKEKKKKSDNIIDLNEMYEHIETKINLTKHIYELIKSICRENGEN